MNYPDQSYLDGDILMYRASFWADENGVDDLEIERRLVKDISAWTPKDTKPVICFSCSRTSNYRRALFPEYKAHRDDTYQPDSLPLTKELIFFNGP